MLQKYEYVFSKKHESNFKCYLTNNQKSIFIEYLKYFMQGDSLKRKCSWQRSSIYLHRNDGRIYFRISAMVYINQSNQLRSHWDFFNRHFPRYYFYRVSLRYIVNWDSYVCYCLRTRFVKALRLWKVCDKANQPNSNLSQLCYQI